ncbi:hypothetical protein DPM13_00945 [Paracoccus mutanolyticus]|uniref:Uncharacterized protein n=2 Tax=Paracoccus mutanolyticus TaxID=1499308 RepID=A0ABN5M3V5_9RHOB|nr:hypothetical protein DPM13_00945 [Paracoccus mutanolyticus]
MFAEVGRVEQHDRAADLWHEQPHRHAGRHRARDHDALSWRLVGLAEKADTQEEGLQTRRLTLLPRS